MPFTNIPSIVQCLRQLLGTVPDSLGPISLLLQLLPPILCGFGPTVPLLKPELHSSYLLPWLPVGSIRETYSAASLGRPEVPEELTPRRPVGGKAGEEALACFSPLRQS